MPSNGHDFTNIAADRRAIVRRTLREIEKRRRQACKHGVSPAEDCAVCNPRKAKPRPEPETVPAVEPEVVPEKPAATNGDGAACVCGCGRARSNCGRGLAPACYQRLRKRVKQGLTTWAKLEAAGECLPSANPHRAVPAARDGLTKKVFHGKPPPKMAASVPLPNPEPEPPKFLTVSQAVAKVIATLPREFTKEQLVIAAWKAFPEKFGMVGHPYPCSWRVHLAIYTHKGIAAVGLEKTETGFRRVR